MNNNDIIFDKLKNKIIITKKDNYTDIISKVINISDPPIRKKNIVMNTIVFKV